MPTFRIIKLAAAYLCFLSFTICSTEGMSMSLFSKPPTEEVVVCSAMEGRLTYRGKPAAGAKLVRWSAWKDEEGETETFFADENGQFLLPTKVDQRKKSGIGAFSQFVAKQLVTVTYQGADYEIWYSSKGRTTLNFEYGGEPRNLMCELTDEPEPFPREGILLSVACKWEIID